MILKLGDRVIENSTNDIFEIVEVVINYGRYYAVQQRETWPGITRIILIKFNETEHFTRLLSFEEELDKL